MLSCRRRKNGSIGFDASRPAKVVTLLRYFADCPSDSPPPAGDASISIAPAKPLITLPGRIRDGRLRFDSAHGIVFFNMAQVR
jgi:hypothetical protein